jgi:WD40 repeat protein
VAFSNDGSKSVSGSSDKTIQVWDASTGAETLPPLQGHNGHVFSVAFSNDGSKIVSGSSDKTIQIWDAKTGAVSGEATTLQDNANCLVSTMPILSIDQDGWVTDSMTGDCLGAIPSEIFAYNWKTKGPYCSAWTTDNKHLIVDSSSAIE